MTPPEDTGTESDERRGAPPLLPDAAGGGDGHEQRRNAVWLLKWLVVVAAVGVLLDSAFGDRDRLAAANKTPLEFVARVENFDRPDAPTLDFQNAPLFLVTSGSFGVVGGRAKSTSPSDSVAVASLPGNDVGAVSMAIFDAKPGSGLVFRYRDPSNYWIITPHPTHGTWSVVKVEAGNPSTLTETANAVGTENVTISVQTTNDDIVVRLNGRMETVLTDAFLAEVPATGMMVKGGDASTAFDDFAIYYPPSL